MFDSLFGSEEEAIPNDHQYNETNNRRLQKPPSNRAIAGFVGLENQ
jgi:hypothetical protein